MTTIWPRGPECSAALENKPHAAHPWGYKRGGGAHQCPGIPEPDGSPPLPLDPTQRKRQQNTRNKARHDERRRQVRTKDVVAAEVLMDAEIDAAIGEVFFGYSREENS